MQTGFLHLHVTIAIAFLLFYFIKVILLLFKESAVDRFREKTKWIDMVLGTLILITGGYLLFIQENILTWMIIKIILVLASIPIGIIAMKRKRKWLGLLAFIVLVYVYGISESKSLTFSKKSYTSENGIVEGKQIFETECMRCHGENGKAAKYGSKDLTVSSLSREEKMEVIKKGKGVMSSYEGKLTDKEINALVDYVETLK